jgi:hypothetical protein
MTLSLPASTSLEFATTAEVRYYCMSAHYEKEEERHV